MRIEERDRTLVIGFIPDEHGDLWMTIEPHLAGGKKGIVLDLLAVRFLNSLSIAAIITARNKVVQHGGKLVLANLSDHVRSVFRVLKLERLFPLDMDLERAVEAAR